VTLDGGEGDDDVRGVFLGSNGYVVTLFGGPGNDLLTVNGSDQARGGSGDDRIVGPAQEGGSVDGETGTDTFVFALPGITPTNFTFAPTDNGLTVSLPPATQTVPWSSIEVADLSLDDGSQTVDARNFSGSLRVEAKDGADTIYGGELGDLLDGGAGNDFIDGGPGADLYQGGRGLDLLHARDGVADSGDCGIDEDTLVADAIDAIGGCERIDLPPPPAGPALAAPADIAKPKLGLKQATLGREKLRLPISCPKSEVRCGGLLTLIGIGKADGKAVRLKLGAITFTLPGGRTKTLLHPVSEKKRLLLRALKQPRLLVKLDVVDASGNRAREKQRVALQS
jgi:Ca2+-binding RTX toxin-like protein